MALGSFHRWCSGHIAVCPYGHSCSRQYRNQRRKRSYCCDCATSSIYTSKSSSRIPGLMASKELLSDCVACLGSAISDIGPCEEEKRAHTVFAAVTREVCEGPSCVWRCMLAISSGSDVACLQSTRVHACASARRQSPLRRHDCSNLPRVQLRGARAGW